MNEQMDQSSGGTGPERIPYKLSEYISLHFRGEFLTKIQRIKDLNGKILYHVDISQDNTLFHLKFNADGAILDIQTEPLIEFSDEEEEYIDD